MAKSQNQKTRRIETPDALDELLNTPANKVSTGSLFNLDDFEEEILETGATWHNWDDEPELIARFDSPVIAREDNGDLWEKGELIGYNMTRHDGEATICPHNYAIAQHLDVANPGDIFRITFLEKTSRDGGRQFTRFKIVKLKAKKK